MTYDELKRKVSILEADNAELRKKLDAAETASCSTCASNDGEVDSLTEKLDQAARFADEAAWAHKTLQERLSPILGEYDRADDSVPVYEAKRALVTFDDAVTALNRAVA
jgi:predicted  nucleic acid-binding Zn-ribbon protein